MIKANIAIHKDPNGKLSLVVLSENADEAIEAVKVCEKPGEISFFRLTTPDKTKKVEGSAEVVSKKSK